MKQFLTDAYNLFNYILYNSVLSKYVVWVQSCFVHCLNMEDVGLLEEKHEGRINSV